MIESSDFPKNVTQYLNDYIFHLSTLFTVTLHESKLCDADEFYVLEFYHFRKWRFYLIMIL